MLSTKTVLFQELQTAEDRKQSPFELDHRSSFSKVKTKLISFVDHLQPSMG